MTISIDNKDRMAGFLMGLTFYPFPVYILDPFKGWSVVKRKWHLIGALSFVAVFFCGVATILVTT